ADENKIAAVENILPLQPQQSARARKTKWVLGLAACAALLLIGWCVLRFSHPSERQRTTSKAVAMLNRVVDAQWNQRDEAPRLGAPLEPGWLRLKSGFV